MFADDTSLYILVDSPERAAGIINTDLSKMSNWAIDWLVRFNTNKTISMLISRKLIQVNHPPLQMDGSIVTEKQSHKHLGITFSKTCTWTEHIDNISKKAWVRLNLLRSLKFRVSQKALEKMYISFILPLLEYCDSVWDNASTESKKKLAWGENLIILVIYFAYPVKPFIARSGVSQLREFSWYRAEFSDYARLQN